MIYFIFLSVFAVIGIFFFKKSQKIFFEKVKSFSYDLMEKNNRSFLDLAKIYFERHQVDAKNDLQKGYKEISSILNPLQETLKKMEENTKKIEKERDQAYGSLTKQVEGLILSENLLRKETQNLAKALQSPNIRGSWGQVHLKRVVELSGMLNRCDFFEQKTAFNEDKILRPDLLVRLPGKRHIIVDAKTPINAYLEASNAKDEESKKEKLKIHVKHLQKHMKDLASKEYWKHFSPSPEYVILFLPAEAFFSAALNEDPSLLEKGVRQNVIIATPTTLIAILRAISFSWRQEEVSKNSEKIALRGKELYERLHLMQKHFENLGKSLRQSVSSYNSTVSSLENRVLVSARKLKELSDIEKDLSIKEIERPVKL